MNRSSSTFKLSDHVDQDKVFLVNLSDFDKRLDTDYYRPKLLDIEKRVRAKATKKLQDFANTMASGATPSVSELSYYADEETGIPFLRVQNLTVNGTLNLKKIKFISYDVHENQIKRSQVSDSDLLVKITGVGRMAIASIPPINFIGNTNQHMVVLRTGSREKSKYLANYLNLDVIEKLASRRATGGTRPALDYSALRSIPVIENINFEGLEKAKTLSSEKKQQAQTLLDGIDEYLLTELGIKIPDVDNSLLNRIFTVQASELLEPRLDPEYLAKKYRIMEDAIKNSLFTIKKLSNVTYLINSGKTPAKTEYVNDISKHDKIYDIIKVGSYSQDLINSKNLDQTIVSPKFEVRKGDIFILSAAHQSEYVGKHIKFLNENLDNVGCVGELICVRANNSIVLNSYLFSILKTDIFKTLINRRKTGQTSHIYPRDIRKIEVPIPNMSKQQEIVEHIDHIRSTATQLQQDADEILASAKHQIENMILGEDT